NSPACSRAPPTSWSSRKASAPPLPSPLSSRRSTPAISPRRSVELRRLRRRFDALWVGRRVGAGARRYLAVVRARRLHLYRGSVGLRQDDAATDSRGVLAAQHRASGRRRLQDR